MGSFKFYRDNPLRETLSCVFELNSSWSFLNIELLLSLTLRSSCFQPEVGERRDVIVVVLHFFHVKVKQTSCTSIMPCWGPDLFNLHAVSVGFKPVSRTSPAGKPLLPSSFSTELCLPFIQYYHLGMCRVEQQRYKHMVYRGCLGPWGSWSCRIQNRQAINIT